MTIEDILKKIDYEKKVESRFPYRVIFCKSFQSYFLLSKQLEAKCDCTLELGNYCASDDSHPLFKNVEKRIAQEDGKHILLLSVSEYLRYAIKREGPRNEDSQFASFLGRIMPANSKTRVYIPLFDSMPLFDRALGYNTRRIEDFLWELDEQYEISPINVTVYSDQFERIVEENKAARFKEWLLTWAEKFSNRGTNNRFSFVTSQYRDAEELSGTVVSVSVVSDPYDYLLQKYSELRGIEKSKLPGSVWADLYVDLEKTVDLKGTLLAAVNLTKMDPITIALRWNTLSDKVRSYIWIFFQIKESESYVGNILHWLAPSEFDSLLQHVADDIIPDAVSHQDWVNERRRIMETLHGPVPSKNLFSMLDNHIPADVFKLLTGATHEERIYAIKTVCRWFRTGGTLTDTYPTVIKTVSNVYPELGWYLDTQKEQYGDYCEYFRWYKQRKIINQPVACPAAHPDYENVKSRYAVISSVKRDNSAIYWIDGLGLEWISLICSVLAKDAGTLFSYENKIAAARIPTETDFNHQWGDGDVKKDKLDKLSHHGTPDDKDYFSCICNQIETVIDMIREAEKMLDKYDQVIITGDHGSSRLAALAFHERKGLFAPPEAEVKSFGRYCRLKEDLGQEDLIDCVEPCTLDNIKYLVMKDYNHYTQSGNAAGGNSDDCAVAGEVHGGMTPEESIIPVIVLNRKEKLFKLAAVSTNAKMKVKNKHGVYDIMFNAPVSQLNIVPSEGECVCSQTDNSFVWHLDFTGLSGEDITLTITANGKILPDPFAIKVITPLGGKNSMGGLP